MMNDNETALTDVQNAPDGAEENGIPAVPETAEENAADKPVEEAAQTAEDSQTAAKQDELLEEIGALKSELMLSKIKIALLLSGTLREKLDEGTSLAAGLCAAGKTPEEAAAEIALAYPHLRAIRREIPQFAAGGSGSSDGFSAIRKIFSAK